VGIGMVGVRYMKQIDKEYKAKEKINNESQKEDK